jgi:hypothetical protein
MLAKWSIPILQTAFVLSVQVEFIHSISELLFVEVDIEGASCRVELLEAEWVQNNLN